MFLFDDLFNNIFNKKQTQENMHNQFVYDIQKMNYQQGLQKSMQEWMWNKQYGAQTAGMRNAGLNPAGNPSGIVGQTAPTVPIASGSAPQGNPSKMDASGALQLASLIKENELKDSEIEVNQAEKDKKVAEKDKIDAEATGQRNFNDSYWERFNKEMNKIVSESNRNDAGTALDKKRLDEVDQAIEKLKVEIDDLKELKEYHHELGRLTKKQADKYDSFIGAQIRHYGSMAALNFGENARRQMNQLFEWTQSSAMADYFDNQSALLRMEKQMQEWQLKMARTYGQAKWWIDTACEILETGADAYYKFATGTSSIMPFSSRSITVAGKNKNGGSYSQTDYFQHRKFGW